MKIKKVKRISKSDDSINLSYLPEKFDFHLNPDILKLTFIVYVFILVIIFSITQGIEHYNLLAWINTLKNGYGYGLERVLWIFSHFYLHSQLRIEHLS